MPLEAFGKVAGQRDAVALDSDVDIEAGLSEAEYQEGCRLLASRYPLPIEFDGLASYDDVEFGRGGLLVALPMPRTFGAALFADTLEMVAETIARISAGIDPV